MVPRIIRLFKPYRPSVTVIGALILVTASVGVVNPVLIKVVFDSALFPPGGGPDLNLLWILVGLMAAIAVASGGLGMRRASAASADQRPLRVIGFGVQIQHVLHVGPRTRRSPWECTTPSSATA